MPTSGEWVFKYLELILKYWKTLASVVVLLSASGYSVYDLFQQQEKEKDKAIQEVAIGFQRVITEVTKPAKPTSCGKCEQELQNHIKEYKRNLREFHGVK